MIALMVITLILMKCFPVPFQFVMSGWGTGYSFHCDLVNYDNSPQAIRVSHSFTNWYHFRVRRNF